MLVMVGKEPVREMSVWMHQGGIVVLTWCEDRDSYRGMGSTDVERYDDPPFSGPLLLEFAFLEWRFTKRAHARCLGFAREDEGGNGRRRQTQTRKSVLLVLLFGTQPAY
jgi:hypothetical protein